MMRSLFFDSRREDFIGTGTWPRESSLDQTVLKYPEIVSRLLSDDDYVVTLAGKDFGGPQLLGIDALFLLCEGSLDEGSSSARLVIWENKRADNVHPRLLVGQVLDYASELAAMSPDAFAQELSSRMSQSTWRESYEAAFHRRRQPVPEIGLVESRARDAHRAGRFTLAVCAQNIPEDVVRMCRWLTDKMTSAAVTAVAIEVDPVGSAGWIRAAALMSVAGEQLDVAPLEEQFQQAVGRFQRIRWAEMVPVEALSLPEGSVALSPLAEDPPVRRSPPSAAISVDAWRASAEPPMRDLCDMLHQRLSPQLAEWREGTSALLLYLKAGDQLVEGLRLYSNRVYFVSEKTLLNLGAEEDARWWRSALPEFLVADPTAKQPVVTDPNIAGLLELVDKLVAFLLEVRERAVRATAMGS
jgi:hypothetical protein